MRTVKQVTEYLVRTFEQFYAYSLTPYKIRSDYFDYHVIESEDKQSNKVVEKLFQKKNQAFQSIFARRCKFYNSRFYTT